MADYYVNSATAIEWVASTAISLGNRRVPSRAYATAAARAWTYECTVAGTTGSTEPTWPTTAGGTVVDGTVTWTARVPSTWANASGFVDYILNNLAVAGDRIFVGPAHSESIGTAYILEGKTNFALPVSIICAQTGPEPPTTPDNTALISTLTSNSITFRNALACYGINFRAGSGANNASMSFDTWNSNAMLAFHDCLLEIGATGTSTQFSNGGTNNQTAGLVLFKNVRLKSAGTAPNGLAIGAQGRIVWDGGSIDTTWSHANLIGTSGPRSSGALFRGVNLSVLGAGKNLVNMSNLVADIEFVNCKLGASVNVSNAVTSAPGGVNVTLHNCDSGATNYRYQSIMFSGQAFSETTIVRSGGSTDGTTPYSIRMLSSANANYHNPLCHHAAAVWNDTTGAAITVTVDIVHDNLTALNDDEVWIEIGYLGASTSPLSSTASDKKALLATAASQAASTATWTTTGLTNPNKQKLEVTFTPQMKGYLLPSVKLARPSYTVYVDNKAVIT